MNLDALFLWPFLASFLAAVAAAMIGAATKTVCRAITRHRISKLPPGPDAARSAEELLGMIEDLKAGERAEYAVNLLRRLAALRHEIMARGAETRGTDRARLPLKNGQRNQRMA